MWVYTATTCFVAAIVVAVAVWGQYTRRERVQGYLSSAVGAATVRMPDAGTVSAVMVKEGDVVVAGAPIARLTIDRTGVNDARGNEAVLHELEARRTSLQHEREQARDLGEQQVEQLRRRIASLREEIRQADTEIGLQGDRLKSATAIAKLWEDLQGKQYASEIYIQQKKDEAKDQEIKVQQLRRQRAALDGALATVQSDVPATQSRARTQIELVDQKIAETSQAVAELGVRREQAVRRDMIVVAPIDGTVTNIGPARGQTVAADTPFATVLPRDNQLHAELLVPTRAIGFVHAGQSVTMRYEAFPYERFGQYGGKVENVGRTVWTQGDSVGPLAVREPVYRIVVLIDRQDIEAGGEHFPLRAGMVVSADLLMERRTLLEWLFQPVLQLRQRMGSGTTAALPLLHASTATS